MWALMAAVLITLGVAFQQQYRSHIKQDFNDFDRWMTMAPAWLRGQTTYVDDKLPTPPLSWLLLGPMTKMERPAAQFVWVAIKLPLAALVFWISISIVRRAGGRLSVTSLVLMLAGWWLPVVVDMQEGQMNFFALLPLVAGLYVAQEDSPATDVGAGLLIGLGAAVKVTPVIFLAYFLWKRRWRITAAGVVSIAIGLFVVPAVVFGWARNLEWLTDWAKVMIVPYVARGHIVYASTQSIGSFVVRLLTATPAFEIHRDGIIEHGYMNVASLSGLVVQRIVRMVMIAVAAGGLLWTSGRLETLRSKRYVLEIGAVAAFMLWFSERTWVHHYVSFVLTLSAAGMVLDDLSLSDSGRQWLKRALLVFAVATLFASEAGRLAGPRGMEWAKAFGVYLWPSVLVTMTAIAVSIPSRSRVPQAVRAMRDSRSQTLATRSVGTVSFGASNLEP